jgi:hypothetical protein
VVGFLATSTSVENAYGPQHVEIAERIGTQISRALANSRLHARISRIAKIREIFVQIGRDANVARDVQELYASVFRNLKNLFPIDRGVIARATEDGKSLILDYVEGADIEGLRLGEVLKLSDLPGTVLSESQLTTVDNAEDHAATDSTRSKLAVAGLPSSIRTPLRARDFGNRVDWC